MSVGTKVRSLRKEQKLSAEQLAVRAGVSSSTLGRLERSDLIPGVPILERIAAQLGTDASALLSEAS